MELSSKENRSGILATLQFSLKATGLLFPVPFYWDEKYQAIKVNVNKLKYCKLWNRCCIAYFAAWTGQMIWFWKKSDVFVKSLDGAALAVFLTFFPASCLSVSRTSDIAYLLNQQIQFEQNRSKGDLFYKNTRITTVCLNYSILSFRFL